ncbi:helix-turn-helix domain-containing protein [Christiangramia portivictoriae]|uniref:helix-turn-helix domain-containing protein n=1 Tax=Christiangramia portivictoriae TaxID=326069 RepID=UPI0004026631|nr:XRE family transcriptional regulator [Christiangramia portivictoriae]
MELGKRIKQLRQDAGLSQQEFADYTGFSVSYIQKFEEGKREMKTNHLIRFSKVLKLKPFDIINTESTNLEYNPTDKSAFSMTNIEYREKQDSHKIFENEIIETISSDFFNIIELENIMDDKMKFKNPVEDILITNGDDIEDAVKVIRKKWKLGKNPIYDVIHLLENKGIKIFEVEKPNSFVAFSGWAGEVPIIVLNGVNPDIARRRFTTLHELAHLILNFNIDDHNKIERFCNHFAGAMLLFEDILSDHFNDNRNGITLEELKNIKSAYGISIWAIIMRALTLSIINWDTYHSWKENYDQWRENDETSFGDYHGVEKPKRFYSLLAKGLNMDNKEGKSLLSHTRAAELSNMTVKDIKARFGGKNFMRN